MGGIASLIARAYAKDDGSMQFSMPGMTYFEPRAIAYLRGDDAEVIKTAFYGLEKKGFIKLSGSGDSVKIAVGRKGKARLSGLEHKIIDLVKKSDSPRELFGDEELKASVATSTAPIAKTLQNMHLQKNDAQNRRHFMIFFATLLVVEALGVTKLYLGYSNDKPVLFLLILCILFVFILFSAISLSSKNTTLGDQYLKELEEHFGWLKNSATRDSQLEGIDPAYSFAIFGAGMLTTGALQDMYTKTLRQNQSGGGCGGCSGGCGGGCGGCGGCG